MSHLKGLRRDFGRLRVAASYAASENHLVLISSGVERFVSGAGEERVSRVPGSSIYRFDGTKLFSLLLHVS